MQSGPDFFTWRILDDWLSRYITLRSRSPETIQAMRARTAEFELVPVPNAIINQLVVEHSAAGLFPPDFGFTAGASGFFDPATLGRTSLAAQPSVFGAVADSRKARHADPVVALLKSLVAGVERGDAAGIAALIADDYRDPAGRDKAGISKAVERFLKTTSARRVILTRLDQYEAVGSDLAVVVSGAWQAEIAGDQGTRTQADLVKMELILSQDRDGKWKIATARHA
jgi:ketosteroid isomerase-like protein